MAGWDDRPCSTFHEVYDRQECAMCGWSYEDHKGAKMTEVKKPESMVDKIRQSADALTGIVAVLEEFQAILQEIQEEQAAQRVLLEKADEDRGEVLEKLDNLNLPGVDFGVESE